MELHKGAARIDYGKGIDNLVPEALPGRAGLGIDQPVGDAPCLAQGVVDVTLVGIDRVTVPERLVDLAGGAVSGIEAHSDSKELGGGP